MARAEAERRIEMFKRLVLQRMLRHELMAWNMLVHAVREPQHNRETVRKALSRMQHRQLAGAFDCYAGAVEMLVAQRKTCKTPAGAKMPTVKHTCCRMVLQAVLLCFLMVFLVDLLHTLSTYKHAYPRRTTT